MVGSNETVVREAVILNREGFHTRPVMEFVKLAQGFISEIRVMSADRKEKEEVDGKSPMGLMLLEATSGTTIRISASGPDAEQATAALVGLVENRFGTEQ